MPLSLFVASFPSIFLLVHLVPAYLFHVSVLPRALADLHRPVAEILPILLSQSLEHVHPVTQAGPPPHGKTTYDHEKAAGWGGGVTG